MEEEDYINSARRNMNNVRQLQKIAEMESVLENVGSLLQKGQKIYDIYNTGKNSLIKY